MNILKQVSGQENPPANTSHGILSFSGGGTLAIHAQALVMGDLFGEDVNGHEVLKSLKDKGFKEVWGTSAGALMASLAAGYSPKEIRSMTESEAFLKSVYAEKDQVSRKNSGIRANYFVHDRKKLGLKNRVLELITDFETAAMEKTVRSGYSTSAKTKFIGQVMSRSVPEDHPAAGNTALSGLRDGKTAGLAEANFEKIYEMTGLHFNFVCQDRATKETVIVTTRKRDEIQPSEMRLPGKETIRYVTGDEISVKDAVSASPTPRPLFDGSVRGLVDGGMAGHNVNAYLAVEMAKARGVDASRINALVVGGLKAETAYRKVRDLMFLATDPFTRFMQNGMKGKLAKLVGAVPSPQKQIVYIAPHSRDINELFNYVTSMVAESEDIKSMCSFFDRFRKGEIDNQQVTDTVGFRTYGEALQGARKMIGLSNKGPAIACDVPREAVQKPPGIQAKSFDV